MAPSLATESKENGELGAGVRQEVCTRHQVFPDSPPQALWLLMGISQEGGLWSR